MVVENGKRIAKNTLFLYVRMFLIMGVSLYTSRVVLDVLGIEDFGIYSLVGGIVLLFSFMNTAMATSTQRFLSYELGKKKYAAVKEIFSMSMTVHISIAILFFLLSETVGLWFLLTQLNIVSDRMDAAFWCYQFSILAMCAQILRIPYHACLIAFERMSFYAFVSVLEVLLKLLVAFSVVLNVANDNLIAYSLSLCIVIVIISLVYKFFCNQKIPLTRYTFFWDKSLYRKIIGFTGWSLLGNAANASVQQGQGVLLNLFYGVALNSAVGVSGQISQAVYSFVSNFQLAFNPVIIKKYAEDKYVELQKILYATSKFSFFLLFIVSTPILIYSDYFFRLWLKEVPEYTIEFSVLSVISMFINALVAPFFITIQASGKIKIYQIIISLILISSLPLGYLCLIIGYSPFSIYLIKILVDFVAAIFRVYYTKRVLPFSVKTFFFAVLCRIMVVLFVCGFLLAILINSDLGVWISVVLIVLVELLIIFLGGMSSAERVVVVEYIRKKI